MRKRICFATMAATLLAASATMAQAHVVANGVGLNGASLNGTNLNGLSIDKAGGPTGNLRALANSALAGKATAR